MVESAQKATIFGVHLYDKLLFRTRSPPLSLHVVIVIVITVALSATTTFMTVRQSAKRGLMQTSMDPSNPMAQSQKFMQYIVPFFSLTGLYWQYGLVLYWVTTNLWTLGQQYFMFRNWEPLPVGAAGAVAGATTGGAAKTAQNPARPGSGTGSSRQSSSRPASAPPRPAALPRRRRVPRRRPAARVTARRAVGRRQRRGRLRPGPRAIRHQVPARPGRRAPADARTGTASRPATTASPPATGQNGTEKRGLLRLGRAKAEPEPQDDVPAAKVVRQQPVRQAKSKRSGKR